MNAQLQDQVIAVTGASSGIGEATALAFADAGAAVALGARRSDRIDALAKRINDAGGKAVAITVDVGEEDQANAFVQQAASELGRLDVLVNNAGVMLLGPVAGAPTDEWREMVHVNVFGVLYCTHAALPIFQAQGSGHVINISSTAGRFARANTGVYNLTKFGIGAFSEALRQETAGHGIRVTLIEPGVVATELQSHNREEVLTQLRERFGDLQPLQATDIADAIVYAASRPANVSVNEVLMRPSGQAF
jgi:NADP-dependent 3-hydroxy acid dehydrogenase YdfG